VAYLLFGSVTHTKWDYARAQLRTLGSKVEAFRIDTGQYPENLEALLRPDALPNARGPYVRSRELIDPWGRQFYYRPDVGEGGFVLFSLGADGMLGGTGQDRDIASERRADG
jgi:general secretion pathway protein G